MRRCFILPGVLPVLLVVTAALVGLFYFFPQLDLAFSGLFYAPGQGFPAAEDPRLLAIRDLFRGLIDAVLLVLLAMTILAVLSRGRRFPARVWMFLLSAWLVGPGLIANALFKEQWGRARPDTIEAFGGHLLFSPPLVISDQCQSNCSFVSGEGAAITMLMMLLGVLTYHQVAPRRRIWLLAVLALPAILGSLLRVAMGRHFLSDSLFAAAFMAIVAAVLHAAFRIHRVRDGVTWGNLWHDLRLLRHVPGRLAGQLRIRRTGVADDRPRAP